MLKNRQVVILVLVVLGCGALVVALVWLSGAWLSGTPALDDPDSPTSNMSYEEFRNAVNDREQWFKKEFYQQFGKPNRFESVVQTTGPGLTEWFLLHYDTADGTVILGVSKKEFQLMGSFLTGRAAFTVLNPKRHYITNYDDLYNAESEPQSLFDPKAEIDQQKKWQNTPVETDINEWNK